MSLWVLNKRYGLFIFGVSMCLFKRYKQNPIILFKRIKLQIMFSLPLY